MLCLHCIPTLFRKAPGILLAISLSGCSVASIAVPTRAGDIVAIHGTYVAKPADPDFAISIRVAGGRIASDQSGDVLLQLPGGMQNLVLRRGERRNAFSFLQANSDGFGQGLIASLLTEQMLQMIPEALACELANPTSPRRDAARRLARQMVSERRGLATGRIGAWWVQSPTLFGPDDRALLSSLLASESKISTATAPASQPTAEDAAILKWDCSTPAGGRFLWKSNIGFRAGALTVAEGKVLVATDWQNPAQPPDAKAGGRIICFDAASGKRLWQITHDPLPLRVHDEGTGILSKPCVDRGRVYYVSNRGELVCAGLADGRRIWTLDMIGQLGIFKRDVNDAGSLAPSPIVGGDLVFCVTGNGGDFDDSQARGWSVPRPDAPSFIAVNKLTGKIVWTSNAPGRNVSYGQWSTPAMATVNCRQIVLFPGGDGLLYAFDPPTGKLLWQVDCRQPQLPGGMDDFIVAPPLVDGSTAYVSLNRDFEQGGGRPHALVAIDLTRHAVRWSLTDRDFDGTFGPMATAGGVLYAVATSGKLLAVDTATGTILWTRQVEDEGQIGGGLYLSDGKIYVAGDGGVIVLSCRCGCALASYDVREWTADATAVISQDTLFVAGREHVWALKAWNAPAVK